MERLIVAPIMRLTPFELGDGSGRVDPQSTGNIKEFGDVQSTLTPLEL